MLMQQQRQQGAAFKLHNPFTLRVAQVFTGFGVGCGIGIGVGGPINLSDIPVLGSAAGVAIGSFSGPFSRLRPHVDSLGKKLGIKNIKAGVGCGVGIGHGFGIGVTLKPSTVQQLKQFMEQAFSAVNERAKSFTGSSASEQGNSTDESSNPVTQGKTLPVTIFPNESTTIQSLGNFMQNTSIDATKSRSTQERVDGEVNRLQVENRILLTLLTHQEQIELLRKENAALKQALIEVEDSSSRPKALSDEADIRTQGKLCKGRTKCFECRRRGWQRW